METQEYINVGWADSYISQLAEGKTVQFRPRGNSMGKHIPSGSLVTVGPPPDIITPKCIVLCKVKGHQYLHFATAIKDDLVKIENAKGFVNGWTPKKNIFGILIKVGENEEHPPISLFRCQKHNCDSVERPDKLFRTVLVCPKCDDEVSELLAKTRKGLC